jgi:hypothetical protein
LKFNDSNGRLLSVYGRSDDYLTPDVRNSVDSEFSNPDIMQENFLIPEYIIDGMPKVLNPTVLSKNLVELNFGVI